MAPSDPEEVSASTGGDLSAREEWERIDTRMDEIRGEMAQDVDDKWSSTWRTEDVFQVKIDTRLSSHQEYQRLLQRRRELEEQNPELLGDAGGSGDGDSDGA